MALTKVSFSMIEDMVVNVKDYGATGDGVTDDKDAINLAFDKVIARGAGTVYLPAGIYRCTNTVGNVSAATNRVSIGVIGEVGTELDFDPSVGANVGLDLRFAELNVGVVENIDIKCNDKVATGVRVRGDQESPVTPVDYVYINKVRVRDCNMVNDANVTTAAAGIAVASDLGINCWIANCYVANVSRDKFSFSTGIEASGFVTTFIANNAIFNVTHNGVTPLQDADGIKVFSFNDGTGRYYRQSTATIINNRVLDCDGRFIKLQTNGNAVVENNTMAITNAMELINNFTAVDTQVGSASICNNKIQSLANYTGGASAVVFNLQFASPSNVFEANETFVVRCESNDFYTKTKLMTYGVLAIAEPTSTAKMTHIVKNNTFSRDGVIDGTSSADNAAVGRFMRITNTATPATFVGQWVLDVSDNKVASNAAFITFSGTNNDDYADKWFFYVYNNLLYSWSGKDVFGTSGGAAPLNDIPYTSTLMVRDNNIGLGGPDGNRVRLPIDVSKILSGSDFETGDSSAPTMTNVPANWRTGRIYKKGLVSGAENIAPGPTAVHYLSNDNGANWYQV